MTTYGFNALVNGLKKSCLAQEILKLKIDAEVMFIKNHMEGKYVNGTRGVIIGFDKHEGWPIVRTYDNKIVLALPEEWQYEENGIVAATITQIPLRLAWAMTIHKSQGMTLDAVEMDLGDVFELGMGYVALSRVRSLDGLKLMNLNELALKVHPKILQYDNIFKNDSDIALKSLQTLSEKEIEHYQKKTLIEHFGIKEKINTSMKARNNRKKSRVPTATHMITLEMLKKNLTIASIAEQRGISVDTLINHIEKLQGLKQIKIADIEGLKKMISETDFHLIFSEFNQSEDGKLKPIYEKFEGKYSYRDIKIVRLFLNKSQAV